MKNGKITFLGFLLMLPLLFMFGFPIYFLMYMTNGMVITFLCAPWFGIEACKPLAMNMVIPLIETIIFLILCVISANNKNDEEEQLQKISNIEVNVFESDTKKKIMKKVIENIEKIEW